VMTLLVRSRGFNPTGADEIAGVKTPLHKMGALVPPDAPATEKNARDCVGEPTPTGGKSMLAAGLITPGAHDRSQQRPANRRARDICARIRHVARFERPLIASVARVCGMAIALAGFLDPALIPAD